MERFGQRVLMYLFALGLAHVLFLIGQELVRTRTLAMEKKRLEAALEAAQSRLEHLRAETEASQDPLYLEALARKAGLVRKEEVLRSHGRLR
ncbi:MAG: septum formation initiator family protein [Thermaceae bacterium]